MKKSLLILLPLMLLACSRESELVPLYQQYAVRQDLTVAQVSGFKLNDSVKVDVVILVADDTTAWQGPKEELDIRTSEGVTSWMGGIDEPARRVKRSQMPLWRVMAVHDDLTIAFYHIDTKTQYDALLEYQMNEIENNK